MAKTILGYLGAECTGLLDDYVVFDLETTGMSSRENEIIEIGAVRVRNHVITERFDRLVKPKTPISGFISDLTGITNSMVQSEPGIEEILPLFLDFAGNDVVIGHNVRFDISFIAAACLQCGFDGFYNDYIDTLWYSRRLYPEEKHDLTSLAARFGIVNERAHRALCDVEATNGCYLEMKAYIEENHIDVSALRCTRSAARKKPAVQETQLPDGTEIYGNLTDNERGWHKELDLIRRNGGTTMLDIREWAPGRARQGKGVTLSEKEARQLYHLLGTWFGEEK